MTKIYTQHFQDEVALTAFAAKFALQLKEEAIIFLDGPLGAGKTTFMRGMLRGLGFSGKVKSPTYTLVEPYEVQGRRIFHFDLYRLKEAAELEQMGIQDYFAEAAILVVEWGERGSPILPTPDLTCYISFAKEGRDVKCVAHSSRGEKILNSL